MTTFISNFIEQQFPEFYRSDNQDFVQFLKAYYEWQEGISETRSLLAFADIDTTPDQFLNYFKNEYMSGVPKQILGDKRLLQKHILNLYNSKGSIEGIRLIFRLLFNEEIEYYLPSEDIFKADNSVWYTPQYLEISKYDTNYQFVDKNIVGYISGARAIVESYERRNINGRVVDILFISNIQGTFLYNESITYAGIDIQSPNILGSINTIEILSSTPGFSVGDRITISSVSESKAFTGMITEVKNGGQGIINFNLVDGGNGYTMNSLISVSSGSNTSGSGAMFSISALSNTYTQAVSNIYVQPYLAVRIGANTYAYSNVDTSPMATANLSTPIYNHLNNQIYTFGKISRITTINPGIGYDGNVAITVKEPLSISLHISDGNGHFYGNDAIITSTAFYGNGVASAAVVISSGFNNYLNVSTVSLTSTSNSLLVAQAKIYDGAVGKVEGYWKDTTSFLDSDKYLQDDDYYQEFSYELILKKRLSEYYDVLMRTVHPSGNKIFGKIRLITEN